MCITRSKEDNCKHVCTGSCKDKQNKDNCSCRKDKTKNVVRFNLPSQYAAFLIHELHK